jgi:phosphoribosylanthranilate isomerase
MTRIKVCGITNREDAEIAAACGVDAIGFVFAESPRRVAPERAREVLRGLDPFVAGVGVFVNSPVEEVRRVLELTGCSVAQLHGDEGPEYVEELAPYGVVKAVRVPRKGQDGAGARPEWVRPPHNCTVLLDTLVPEKMGGTGERFDLAVAEAMVREGYRVIVAGGVTTENVAEVVRRVRPYGVDVSSGVEAAPGRKDHQKLKRFVETVRVTDQEIAS